MNPWKTTMWCALILAVVMLALLACGGCSPAGIVAIDTDGNGIPDTPAVDADGDGRPDLGADGKPFLITDLIQPETMERLYKADDLAPSILDAGGTAASLIYPPVGVALGLLAGFWRRNKLGKIAADVIMHVQMGKKRLREKGYGEAVDILNESLKEQQPATIKFVAVTKADAAIKEADKD